MQKIGNFDIVINRCLWEVNQESTTADLEKKRFLAICYKWF